MLNTVVHTNSDHRSDNLLMQKAYLQPQIDFYMRIINNINP